MLSAWQRLVLEEGVTFNRLRVLLGKRATAAHLQNQRQTPTAYVLAALPDDVVRRFLRFVRAELVREGVAAPGHVRDTIGGGGLGSTG